MLPGDDEGKIEQALFRLLDYQAEHKVDLDGMLIMLSLLNLMGMINVLGRGGTEQADSGATNIQALLTPLLGLMAAGMMSRGQQAPINPAMLLSLLGALGGSRGKGGQPDFSGLIGLLGPLFGLGGQGGPAGQPRRGPGDPAGNDSSSGGTRPVHREINLDQKNKTAPAGQSPPERDSREKKETLPKPGEVLEWKFGT
jgi:hypothetical protein